MDYKKIASNINAIREARGWSKDKLAKRTGISYTSVVNHTTDGQMSLESLAKYAGALGCTIGDLTDGFVNKEDFHMRDDITSYFPYNVAVLIMHPNLETPEDLSEARDLADHVYAPAVMESINSLTERERNVIIMRFDNMMTLEEIGKEFKVNRERIRQIEARALRKLRYPSRWKKWRKDTMDKAMKAEAECFVLKAENQVLREKLRTIKEAVGIKETPEEKYSEISLDDLEMSVRLYNILKRNSVRTLADLTTGWTKKRVYTTRNMGRRTADELLDILEKHSIFLPDE